MIIKISQFYQPPFKDTGSTLKLDLYTTHIFYISKISDQISYKATYHDGNHVTKPKSRSTRDARPCHVQTHAASLVGRILPI